MDKQIENDNPTWRSSVFSISAWEAHLLVVFGAVCAGLGALFFAFMEHYSGAFLQSMGDQAPYWCLFIIPAGLTLVIWLRDRFFPGTDGTGIPQTITALQIGNCSERNRCLSLRIALGKIVLTTIGLFSQLSIGREGPSVQLGACFMHVVSKLHRFPEHLIQRGLILGGGAAGIAAAFNAPIAGIVFSMEEIGRSFDKRNMGTTVRIVIIACVVCMIGLGNYYFYGNLDHDRDPLVFNSWKPWLAVIIIGIVGGALGGLFSKTLLYIMPITARLLKTRKLVTAVSIGIIIALIGFLSDGTSLGGGYTQARALVLQGSPVYLQSLPLEEQQLISEDYEAIKPLYPVYRAASSFLVLCTAIPGGLFDPSFSVGAGLGHVSYPLFAWTGASSQAIILLFIVAYFSGVVQSPMTSFIILIEMTGCIMFSLPLGLAAILGYEISRLICPTALYEALAERFAKNLKPAEQQK